MKTAKEVICPSCGSKMEYRGAEIYERGKFIRGMRKYWCPNCEKLFLVQSD